MAKPLTEKQVNFVNNYLLDRKPKSAAIRAGYPEKSASVLASRLLRDPRIQKLVKSTVDHALTKHEVKIDRDRILAEYAVLAQANLADDKITGADKRGALDSLSKIYGLFQESAAVTAQQFVINVHVESPAADADVVRLTDVSEPAETARSTASATDD